jgi:hypothetical protein
MIFNSSPPRSTYLNTEEFIDKVAEFLIKSITIKAKF